MDGESGYQKYVSDGTSAPIRFVDIRCMQWEGVLFVDIYMMVPFGLRLAPKVFTTLENGSLRKGVWFCIHCLDH